MVFKCAWLHPSTVDSPTSIMKAFKLLRGDHLYRWVETCKQCRPHPKCFHLTNVSQPPLHNLQSLRCRRRASKPSLQTPNFPPMWWVHTVATSASLLPARIAALLLKNTLLVSSIRNRKKANCRWDKNRKFLRRLCLTKVDIRWILLRELGLWLQWANLEIYCGLLSLHCT